MDKQEYDTIVQLLQMKKVINKSKHSSNINYGINKCINTIKQCYNEQTNNEKEKN